jgi:hypothetical protein
VQLLVCGMLSVLNLASGACYGSRLWQVCTRLIINQLTCVIQIWI